MDWTWGKNSSPRLTAMAKKVTPNCRDCEGPPVFSSASGSSPLRSSAKCCVNKGSSRAAAQKTAQLYQNLEGFCNFFRSGSLWIYSKFWIHQVCNVEFRVPKPEPPKETWLRDCLTNGRPKTQTTALSRCITLCVAFIPQFLLACWLISASWISRPVTNNFRKHNPNVYWPNPLQWKCQCWLVNSQFLFRVQKNRTWPWCSCWLLAPLLPADWACLSSRCRWGRCFHRCFHRWWPWPWRLRLAELMKHLDFFGSKGDFGFQS